MEIESRAIELLERIGISKGQTVLDFGCGYGIYTIPVAKIVGKQGRVYALDKEVPETLTNGNKDPERGKFLNFRKGQRNINER